MSDIFLSYASEDRPRVGGLIRALERHGWSVWWDRTIPLGRTFDQVIEEALDAARCVMVVWSQHSVHSDWVKTEAAEGARRHILVPVLLDEVRIPLEFRRMQAARLLDWHDTGPHPEFDKVVQAVTHYLRPSSLTAEETLGAEAATPMRPPPNPASSGDDRPFSPVPPREAAATPSVNAQDQPEVHRHTTSNTRKTTGLSRRPKRRLLLVGGVLLCVLIPMLYVALSGRTPDPQWQPGPALQKPQDSTMTTPRTPTPESGHAQNPGSSQLASPITNSLGMQLVLIPAGTFQMGSTNEADAERPVHTVRISKPFYLGIHEVTQGQWEAVMGNNPSLFKGDANRPVESVSWGEVLKFIDQLNARESGTKYRLPTEAEWEYAARAGSATAYSFGDDSSQLGKYAWFGGNADGTTHPVGKLRPNAWGLYDMHGNVWEWVQDWYGKYTAETVTDPQGPAWGSDRVIRGGSWLHDAGACRSACRFDVAPGYRSDRHGFRLLRTAP
jgi:formylglycine-generating enzyme required for sulfatase activity